MNRGKHARPVLATQGFANKKAQMEKPQASTQELQVVQLLHKLKLKPNSGEKALHIPAFSLFKTGFLRSLASY